MPKQHHEVRVLQKSQSTRVKCSAGTTEYILGRFQVCQLDAHNKVQKPQAYRAYPFQS